MVQAASIAPAVHRRARAVDRLVGPFDRSGFGCNALAAGAVYVRNRVTFVNIRKPSCVTVPIVALRDRLDVLDIRASRLSRPAPR